MSYRGVKRVLGETNLERKCLFLFGISLLFFITGSFYYFGRQTENLVFDSNNNTGRLLVDTAVRQIHWERNEPSADEALFAELLGGHFQKSTPYRASFIKPSPEATDGAVLPADAFEWQVLEDFKNGVDEPRQRRIADKEQFHYYQPVRYSHEGCIICHQSQSGQPAQVGSLAAVAKVVIPEGYNQRRLTNNRAILIATAIVTVFLSMSAAYLIVRYVIAKPLAHLKE
ncbi:MAG: DUF3365 domain-containing protein, partial [Planctomycetales bacterium]